MNVRVAGRQLNGAPELFLRRDPAAINEPQNCGHTVVRVRQTIVKLQCLENHWPAANHPIPGWQLTRTPSLRHTDVRGSVIGVCLDSLLEIIYSAFGFVL